MSDNSHDKSVADGIRLALQGLPCPPQQPKEPWDLYTTRQNTFDWQKKQDGK